MKKLFIIAALMIFILYPLYARAVPQIVVAPALDQYGEPTGIYYGDMEEAWDYIDFFTAEYVPTPINEDDAGWAVNGTLSILYGDNSGQPDLDLEIRLVSDFDGFNSFDNIASQRSLLSQKDGLSPFSKEKIGNTNYYEFNTVSLGTINETINLTGIGWEEFDPGEAYANAFPGEWFIWTGVVQFDAPDLEDTAKWIVASFGTEKVIEDVTVFDVDLLSPKTSGSAFIPEPASAGMIFLGFALIVFAVFLNQTKGKIEDN